MTWEHRKKCPYVVFEGTTFRVLNAAHLTAVAKSWDGATWLLVKCALIAVYRTGFVDCAAQQSYCILLHFIIHWPMVVGRIYILSAYWYVSCVHFTMSLTLLTRWFLRTIPTCLSVISTCFPDFPYLFLVNLNMLFGLPKHYYTQIQIQK